MSIAKEIPVDSVGIERCADPRNAVHHFVEGERAAAITALGAWRLIEDGPTVAREQAFLE